MGHPQVFASELLASVTPQASADISRIAIKNKSGSAAEIAARLGYMADDLSKPKLYQLSPNMQSLSLQALQDLVEICNWPTLSTPGRHDHLRKTPQELRDILDQIQKSKDCLQSIEKFFKAKPDTIRPFQSRFIVLSDELTKHAQALQGTGTDDAACSHLKPLAKDVYPDKVNKLLLDGVRSIASCMPKYHRTPTETDTHLTRLCLNSGFRLENQLAVFNVITTTSKMAYWQELAISVPINEINEKDAQDLENSKKIVFDPAKLSLIECGAVCKRLENPSYAKIYLDLDENCNIYERPDPDPPQHIISGCGVQLCELLKQCELTVEHKIKLSHAIARAFWLFYSSELMNARWTSEDLLFVPHDGKISELQGIPLRAFVSFPFGTQYKDSPEEFCEKDLFTHRYPRILYLGIVLLEIGLGRPLELERDFKLSLLSHTNIIYMKAKRQLKELKKAKWDGFRWKDYFVEAVENCLESNNFQETYKRRKSRSRGDTNKDEKTVSYSALPERREVLYRKVVAPLFWLAKIGFEDTEEVPVVPISGKIRRTSTFADDDDKEIQSFWNGIRENSSFHSGGDRTPRFLEDLQHIAGHIFRCRRKVNVTTPIRVAILDTGCQRDMAFFQDPHRSERLKGWKDFTSAASEIETDAFGNGTFMVRLIMHVAPIVDVYLIRVAKNTEDLESSQENICKAIEHAGLDPDWKVDVVSMSFGFPRNSNKTYPVISDAIERVRKERKDSVLFLASAGDSWEGGLNFPASHQDVIPIYAGDCNGRFLESTPAQTKKGPEKLGTWGTNIPPSITEEVRVFFPKADLSAGTPIATAIAAGIVAMTLSYIAALPSLLQFPQFEQVCAKIYTKKGMEQMLYNMSLCTNWRQKFINPVWFWAQKQKDLDIMLSICSAVERMNEE
ncbi:hypothetical protein MMC07_009065 [Pseudocyphellaria aurata]|nr:hypothetical protein [Pseudocyphellaria aurata]